MSEIFDRTAQGNVPPWPWIVEFIGAVIASAGTPPTSLNRNPRYSNRINRPSNCDTHRMFFSNIWRHASDLTVVTTNYDTLIERALRHKRMQRPKSPGCHYGGLPRPQILKGAAQPFSKHSYERHIEMSGSVPVYKLHGSLNWSVVGESVVAYQDMRAAFRHGGNAAIIPPVPEKRISPWLSTVWEGAAGALQRAATWIVCGYSAPEYDTEVLSLLRRASGRKSLTILLSSPDSASCTTRWQGIAPGASIIPVPGLPAGNQVIGDYFAASRSKGC